MRKIILGLGIAFILLLLGILIWFLLPVKELPFASIIPKETTFLTRFQLPLVDKGIISLYDYLGRHSSRKLPPRFILKYFLPSDILGCGIIERDNYKNPKFIIAFRMGRLVKIIKIFTLWLPKPYHHQKIRQAKILYPEKATKGLYSYAILYDSILLSNNLPLLKETLKSDRAISPSPKFEMTPLPSNLLPAHIQILFNNKGGVLTAALKDLEKNLSFKLFPSITAVQSLEIYGKILDFNSAQGIIVAHTSSERVSDVTGDLHFLARLIRRKLRVEGARFKSSLSSEKERVILNYEIANLKTLWEKLPIIREKK
jgi:hypothetical protein